MPNNNFQHGHACKGHVTPEYRAWALMKRRCTNQNDQDYYNYGERGIKVCTRWFYCFENFLLDMGLKPSSQHSLDRIEGEKDYFPENCRWATPKEQSRNRRDRRLLTYDGQMYCLNELAELKGINRRTLAARLDRGLSVAAALEGR